MGLLFESLWYDLLLTAVLLVFYLRRKVKSTIDFFRETGMAAYVPYESLLANNTFGAFAEGSMGEVYDKIYRQLSGYKYGGFFNTLKPCVMVRDPETALRLLTTDFQHFADHGLTSDEDTNPLEGNLFFLSGPRWKTLRRKLSPTFTSGKLKNMFSLMEDCADELVGYLESRSGTTMEMKEILARFTTDVIGSTAFGLEPVSIKNPDSQFRRMGKKFFSMDYLKIFKGLFRFMVPWVFRTFHISTQPKELVEFFTGLTSQTIAHRMATGAKRNDFVQLLVELKVKGSVQPEPTDLQEIEPEEASSVEGETSARIEFTDGLLAAQAFVFFIAGFETTASAISFTLYCLAERKDCQDRARGEVREAKEKRGGRIDYEAVKSMKYLEACMSESLRLYPPVQALPRLCTRDYLMEDGYLLRKGTTLFVPVFSFHRDPDYFPEPEVFRPERFVEGVQPPAPGTYLPFGAGPRICIGQRFAMLESLIALAKVLDAFQVGLGPNMIPGKLIKLKSQLFIGVPADGLWLNFTKIQQSGAAL